MVKKITDWAAFERISGADCLDFVNSVSSRPAPVDGDYLLDYEDVVQCLLHTSLGAGMSADVLLAYPAANPVAAEYFFREMHQLRDLLDAALGNIAAAQPIEATVLDDLNTAFATILPFCRLVPAGEGLLAEEMAIPQGDPNRLKALLLLDARRLLLSAALPKVRACPRCGWLFLDTSKNGKRRWCSMSSCGSADKALNYYRRKKSL